MYVNTKCEQVGPSFPNPRPGYEVDNSRVKLHQPRPEAAFQKMMNKRWLRIPGTILFSFPS